MSKPKRRPAQAYLLRCWQEGSSLFDGEKQWRFSVEEVLHERRQRGFTSVKELCEFLHTELARSETGRIEGEPCEDTS